MSCTCVHIGTDLWTGNYKRMWYKHPLTITEERALFGYSVTHREVSVYFIRFSIFSQNITFCFFFKRIVWYLVCNSHRPMMCYVTYTLLCSWNMEVRCYSWIGTVDFVPYREQLYRRYGQLRLTRNHVIDDHGDSDHRSRLRTKPAGESVSTKTWRPADWCLFFFIIIIWRRKGNQTFSQISATSTLSVSPASTASTASPASPASPGSTTRSEEAKYFQTIMQKTMLSQ